MQLKMIVWDKSEVSYTLKRDWDVVICINNLDWMNYKMSTDRVSCIYYHNDDVIRSIINAVISYHIICVLWVGSNKTRQDKTNDEMEEHNHSLTYHTKNSIPNSNWFTVLVYGPKVIKNK